MSGAFQDCLDEVTHFIAKIPVKGLLLGWKLGAKFIEKGVRGVEKFLFLNQGTKGSTVGKVEGYSCWVFGLNNVFLA